LRRPVAPGSDYRHLNKLNATAGDNAKRWHEESRVLCR
jgi:hypothetical protein